MKLNQYLSSNKAEKLPIEVGGNNIEDVYFRRLSAGEGLQLKESFADLLAAAGDVITSEGDVAKAEEKAKRMTPEQLRVMFKFQALFTFLHLGNKDGSRAYEDREEFEKDVPDEFIQEFYRAGSEHKNKTEASEGEAEGNSSTPTA